MLLVMFLLSSCSLQFHNREGAQKLLQQVGHLSNINDSLITIQTNIGLNYSWDGSSTFEWDSDSSTQAACVWQSMFKPVPPILQAAQAELGHLFPGESQPYVTVHLRLGGLEGEWGKPGPDRGKAPLENFLAAVKCASELTANSTVGKGTPALVITDNHVLRKVVQGNHFQGLVSPSGLPVHLALAKGQSLDAHRRTVVDMVLLASGECLATSKSGFSLHAWLYGGAKPCMVPWTNCL
jgi:hypothetical protein